MADIGENIRNARTAAGITQRELADDLYVVQQSVYKWKNGMSYPQSDKQGTVLAFALKRDWIFICFFSVYRIPTVPKKF